MTEPATPPGPPALPRPLRRPLTVVAWLAAAVLALLATRYGGEVAAGRLDTWAQATAERLFPDPGVPTRLVRAAGDPLPVIVLSGLLAAAAAATGRRRAAVLAVAGPGLTGVATTVLKPLIGRTIYGEFAYPSGHTAAVTALALVAALLAADLLHARALPATVLVLATSAAAAIAMAVSLLAQHIHYATDTVGGYCTAMAVVPATARLIDRTADRRRERSCS